MAMKKLKLAHPGKILREESMEPVGLSAYALAKALEVLLPRVNDIVREKRAISPEGSRFGYSTGCEDVRVQVGRVRFRSQFV